MTDVQQKKTDIVIKFQCRIQGVLHKALTLKPKKVHYAWRHERGG